MDQFSHYIFAFLLGSRLRLDKPQLQALLVSALIPDIDAVTGLFGLEYFRLYHRTATHSIFIVPFLALAVAGIFWLIYKKNTILPALLGAYTHLMLDIFNLPKSSLEYMDPHAGYNQGHYDMGVAFFWPLSNSKYSLYDDITTSTLAGKILFFSVMTIAVAIFIFLLIKGPKPWAPWLPKKEK